MKLVTYSKEAGTGWSAPFDPALDGPRTFVLVFGAPDCVEDPATLAGIAAAFPNSCVTGCSTAGEIHGACVLDHSLVVAVAAFEHTGLRIAHADVPTAANSREAGRSLAAALHGESLRGVLVLSDGLGVNGSELARGINESLPADVAVTGGLAGDGSRFSRTWVLRDGRATSSVVTAVGFYGEQVQFSHGSRGGWDKFGPERIVTRSEGNVLYELDGKPALELYKRYLGERAAGLPATGLLFPLALRENTADPNVVVRTLLAVDEARQSMTFAGDITQGWMCQLMSANFDRLIAGAAEAAQRTTEGAGESVGDVLGIAISCVGRRLILGERTEEELEATLDSLPARSQQVGFYSYGELSPHENGACDLHNQTMTLTAIGECDRRAA